MLSDMPSVLGWGVVDRGVLGRAISFRQKCMKTDRIVWFLKTVCSTDPRPAAVCFGKRRPSLVGPGVASRGGSQVLLASTKTGLRATIFYMVPEMASRNDFYHYIFSAQLRATHIARFRDPTDHLSALATICEQRTTKHISKIMNIAPLAIGSR